MWTYLGPSCPDRPSSEELSATEVEAWIHKVLDFGVIPTPNTGPAPLWRGNTSVKVSSLGPVSTPFMILSFHHACDPTQGLGVDPLTDAAGWEVRHTSSGDTWACEERESSTCHQLGGEKAGDESPPQIRVL
jgi:hypothetical protein